MACARPPSASSPTASTSSRPSWPAFGHRPSRSTRSRRHEPTPRPRTHGADDDLARLLRKELADGVRTRRCRDGLLVLAPDGTTALALDDTDLTVLAGPDTAARTELVDELTLAGVLATSPPPGHDTDRRRLTRTGVEIDGIDRLADAATRVTARFTARHLTLASVALILAVAATIASDGLVTSGTAAGLGPVAAAAVLAAIGLMLGVVHELGHAIVLARCGGRIGRAGFGFHWGAPSFYVDSTSALFLPTHQRIAQAGAGVAAELLAAAAAVTVAGLTGSDLAQFVAGATAVYAASSAIVNGAPVLGLDGSLILADLLDRPTLPTGAGRTSTRFAIAYRTLDLAVGVAAIAASTWLWAHLWWDLLGPLWTHSHLGKLVALAAAGPTLAALTIGLLGLWRDRPDHPSWTRPTT